MADLHPDRFLADVLDQPAALAAPAAASARWSRSPRARRVLFLGMGSSGTPPSTRRRYCARTGVDAHAELASTGLPQPPSPDTLVVAISATGGSAETVAAMRRHLGTSMVVGVTSRPAPRSGRRPISA